MNASFNRDLFWLGDGRFFTYLQSIRSLKLTKFGFSQLSFAIEWACLSVKGSMHI